MVLLTKFIQKLSKTKREDKHISNNQSSNPATDTKTLDSSRFLYKDALKLVDEGINHFSNFVGFEEEEKNAIKKLSKGLITTAYYAGLTTITGSILGTFGFFVNQIGTNITIAIFSMLIIFILMISFISLLTIKKLFQSKAENDKKIYKLITRYLIKLRDALKEEQLKNERRIIEITNAGDSEIKKIVDQYQTTIKDINETHHKNFDEIQNFTSISINSLMQQVSTIIEQIAQGQLVPRERDNIKDLSVDEDVLNYNGIVQSKPFQAKKEKKKDSFDIS